MIIKFGKFVEKNKSNLFKKEEDYMKHNYNLIQCYIQFLNDVHTNRNIQINIEMKSSSEKELENFIKSEISKDIISSIPPIQLKIEIIRYYNISLNNSSINNNQNQMMENYKILRSDTDENLFNILNDREKNILRFSEYYKIIYDNYYKPHLQKIVNMFNNEDFSDLDLIKHFNESKEEMINLIFLKKKRLNKFGKINEEHTKKIIEQISLIKKIYEIIYKEDNFLKFYKEVMDYNLDESPQDSLNIKEFHEKLISLKENILRNQKEINNIKIESYLDQLKSLIDFHQEFKEILDIEYYFIFKEIVKLQKLINFIEEYYKISIDFTQEICEKIYKDTHLIEKLANIKKDISNSNKKKDLKEVYYQIYNIFYKKKYIKIFEEIDKIDEVNERKYINYYFYYHCIVYQTYTIISNSDKDRNNLNGFQIKHIFKMIKKFFQATIYFYTKRNNQIPFEESHEKEIIFQNLYRHKIKIRIKISEYELKEKEEEYKLLLKTQFYEYMTYIIKFQELIDFLSIKISKKFENEKSSNEAKFNSIFTILEDNSFVKKREKEYNQIKQISKNYKKRLKNKANLAIMECLDLSNSLEFNFDLATEIFLFLRNLIYPTKNLQSQLEILNYEYKNIFTNESFVKNGEFLLYLNELINNDCKKIQVTLVGIQKNLKNFFCFLIYQLLYRHFLEESSFSIDLFSSSPYKKLILSAYKVLQNLCEGHNEKFQDIMFNLNLDGNVPIDYKKNENKSEIVINENKDDPKDKENRVNLPLTNLLMNILRIIYDNLRRSIIIGRKQNYKFFNHCIDLTIEIIQGSKHRNLLYFFDISEKDKVLKNKKSDNNEICDTDEKISNDKKNEKKKESIQKTDKFVIEYFLNEVKKEFKGFKTNKVFLNMQISVFKFLNNLINQKTAKKSYDNFSPFFKKLLIIFEPDLMITKIALFMKVIYLKYVIKIDPDNPDNAKNFEKELENFYFDKNSLNNLIKEYTSNQNIFSDIYFEWASQMFRFLKILAVKYELDLQLQKVILLKDKEFRTPTDNLEDNEKGVKKKGKMNEDGNNSRLNTKENRFNDNIATSKFFAKFIKEIEFNFSGKNLKKIFFIIEPKVYYIPINSIAKFKDEVPRTNPSAKLNSLIQNITNFYCELKYLEEIKEKKIQLFLYDLNYTWSDSLNFIIALYLNFLLISRLTVEELNSGEIFTEIVLICYLQILINFSYMVFFLYSKYTLSSEITKLEISAKNKNNKLSPFDYLRIYLLDSFVFHSDIRLIFVNTIFACIIILNPNWIYICILQLFTIYKFVPTIRDLMIAFTLSMTQLISMIIFLIILMFIYANIGFFFFNDNFITLTDQVFNI